MNRRPSTACSGQPPFDLDASALAPGEHALAVACNTFPDMMGKATLTVVKVDVEPSKTNVAWTAQSATLGLTSDSYPGGDVEWTVPSGLSYTPSTGRSLTIQPGSSNPGEYTVVARSQVFPDCSDSCVVRVVEIVLGAVDDADYIGTLDAIGSRVYATAQDQDSHVTIRLKTNPEGQELPDAPVAWIGGEAGDNNLQRKFSKANLCEDGSAVIASVAGRTVFKGAVYVFRGVPPERAASVRQSPERQAALPSGNKCSSSLFGACSFAGGLAPSLGIGCYYENGGTWRFALTNASYAVLWATAGRGRTDLPASATGADPFPCGMGREAIDTTEAAKKTCAKADLAPGAGGNPTRDYYWSSELTEQHERFHMSDFQDHYAPWIEGIGDDACAPGVAVTLSNLRPGLAAVDVEAAIMGAVMNSFEQGLWSVYSAGGADEARAYEDGRAAYQALVDAIRPDGP